MKLCRLCRVVVSVQQGQVWEEARGVLLLGDAAQAGPVSRGYKVLPGANGTLCPQHWLIGLV